MKDDKVVFVVPARGGSKGIPKKNLLPIGGIPLVARSVNYGLNCSFVDDVYVSSDCGDILMIGEEWGAKRHERSLSSASDCASTEDFLFEFIDSFGSAIPRIIVYVQPTTPFLIPAEIDAGIKLIRGEKSIDTVFSAKPMHSFVWRKGDDGGFFGVNHNSSDQRQRRQNIINQDYIEDGGFYVLRTDTFLKTGSRFGGKSVAYPSKLPIYPEIDERYDYEYLCTASLYFERISRNMSPSIRLVISEFDGVMTDDSVFISEQGVETVRCTHADGIGVSSLKKKGIEVVIVSTETNGVVRRRADKLGIESHCAVRDKLKVIKNLCNQKNIFREEVIFIGNDVNDLEALRWVGEPLIPKDANPELFRYGFKVLDCAGGAGVIREIASLFSSG